MTNGICGEQAQHNVAGVDVVCSIIPCRELPWPGL